MNTLLHFLLLFQFCRSLRNISLGDCILGKSNVIITVGWLWWRHQRAPLFSLASGPPNPKPTTGYERVCYERVCYEHDLLWKWSVLNGSVTNMVCYESGLFWTGLLWIGLLWTWSVLNGLLWVVCYERVCFEWEQFWTMVMFLWITSFKLFTVIGFRSKVPSYWRWWCQLHMLQQFWPPK